MFRITKDDQPLQTVITIEGDLARDCVSVADHYCSRVLDRGRSLLVVLRDVSVVDQDGRGLLLRLAKAGARLRGIGIYTSYIVEQVQQAIAGSSGEHGASR